MTFDLIRNAKIIFWDFDGVIKESVSVKSEAFYKLFLNFGSDLAKKVKNHHENNGGMSRYEKLPIYLNWAGEKFSKDLIIEYEKQFSYLVKQKVINSPWVEGVLNYLQRNFERQMFFLVTATPQLEIDDILRKLEIEHFFKKVIGSPLEKKEALHKLLNNYNIKLREAIMIGDSFSDYEAAKKNQVTFIIRKTELNKKLQKKLKFRMIENFSYG